MSAVGKVIQVIGQAVLHGIDGTTKAIFPGDIIVLGDVIETMMGSKVVLELVNGRAITIGANEQLAVDQSLLAEFDELALDGEDLQDALEKGLGLSEDEEQTAAGEETGQLVSLNDYLSGDTSEGYVGSYLLDSGNISFESGTDDTGSSEGGSGSTQTEETSEDQRAEAKA